MILVFQIINRLFVLPFADNAHRTRHMGYEETLKMLVQKQDTPDADPKAIQQINFNGNLDQAGETTFFIIEEAKETISYFSHGTVRVLYMCCKIYFVLIQY